MRRTSAPSQILKRKSIDTEEARPFKQLSLNYGPNGNDESKAEDTGGDYEEMIRKILFKPFQVPIKNYNGGLMRRTLGIRRDGVKRALHDPMEENALILFEPKEIKEHDKLTLNKDDIQVHVVVDPALCAILRPHQREGVKFMYDCVMGNQIGTYSIYICFVLVSKSR